MKLGARPIVSLKRCVKCGRKQGLRAKKQFKWPLWEAMFDQSCICGGLWRRENRKVTLNSQPNIAYGNENAPNSGAGASTQNDNKSQNSQISSQ